jgi:farnesyl-diphosphate farnesyltransferase
VPPAAPFPRDLDLLLRRVSRSFYLSLRVLPPAVRVQLKAAYLVARAADTIADTRILPSARRLELLRGLRAAIDDGGDRAGLSDGLAAILPSVGDRDVGSAAERELLERIESCLDALARFDDADRARARKVLGTLITGMERDLSRFPNAQPGDPPPVPVALETLAELDEHTYYAAGCVGEYWTLMCAAHVPGLERLARPDLIARGVRLGKALQMVNVLRDIPADLREGRCYLPMELLARAELRPNDLTDPSRRLRARPILEELRGRALAHVDAAFPYVLEIPAVQPRLRLAALWPLWIGLGTLGRLRDAIDPLDPMTVIKISRRDVYEIVAESLPSLSPRALSDRWLRLRHQSRRRAAG